MVGILIHLLQNVRGVDLPQMFGRERHECQNVFLSIDQGLSLQNHISRPAATSGSETFRNGWSVFSGIALSTTLRAESNHYGCVQPRIHTRDHVSHFLKVSASGSLQSLDMVTHRYLLMSSHTVEFF